VFGWLSGEIRDRKHLRRGEAALFVRALYSMQSLRASLVYGVTRTKQTRNLPSQRDAIPSLVPTKDKSVYELFRRLRILFFSLSLSCACARRDCFKLDSLFVKSIFDYYINNRIKTRSGDASIANILHDTCTMTFNK